MGTILAVVAGHLWYAPAAEAVNEALKGTYNFGYSRTCDSNVTIVFTGLITYDGVDPTGGGTVTGTSSAIFSGGSNTGNLTCTVSYTVNPADGTVDQTWTCSVALTSGGTGTVTVDDIKVPAQLSLDGTVLGFANTTGIAETVTPPGGTATPRICAGTGAATSRR